MARLIDAEFIEKWINREEHNTPEERWRPESEFAAMVDNAPTVDAVEVVRCENCKFWIGEMYKDPTLGYCEICDRVTDNDDFCSTGIKMDGGDK